MPNGSLLSQIARGSNFDPFGSFQQGQQIKQRRQRSDAQVKSQTLSDQVRQAQLDQADRDAKDKIAASQMEQELNTYANAFMAGDQQAAEALQSSGPGRKILADLIDLQNSQQSQNNANERLVLDKDKFAVSQDNQARSQDLAGQRLDLDRQRFEASVLDQNSDNARADANLQIRRDVQEQRQQQIDARAAQGPKLTADAAKSQGFHLRMSETSKILDAFEADPGFDPTNFKKGPLTSQSHRQYNQAKENWVRANLRAESGAVIGDDEMKSEIKVYFPQPFDGPDVIEQKRAARKISEQAMSLRAGITQAEQSSSNADPLTVDVSQINDLDELRRINEALSQ